MCGCVWGDVYGVLVYVWMFGVVFGYSLVCGWGVGEDAGCVHEYGGCAVGV